MEINVANQRILVIKNQITQEEAEKKAWENKTISFDTLSKMTSFFSRPKDEDFKLLYHESRYQPFWHVVAKAKYVYDRNATYQISVSGEEVKTVTMHKNDYNETNGHIHVPVLEHCTQKEHNEVYTDGVSGKNQPDLAKYISLSSAIVKDTLEKLVPKDSILVPPQTRVSAIMRDALAKMIKGIQADTIIEEAVEVACVDLYYRPVFAFQYRWISKNKEAIIEVDGLSGEVSSGNRTFGEYLGKVLDKKFLLDIGTDAAGLLIPGGNIAVKVAKHYIETKKD